jgi:hypothetical protein
MSSNVRELLTGCAITAIYGLLWLGFARFCYQRLLRPVMMGSFVIIGASVLDRRHPLIWIFTLFGLMLALIVTQMIARYVEVRSWRDNPQSTLILRSPFACASMVAVGGPFSRGNHHTRVAAQRFAYDIIVPDDDSMGHPVLAPIDGCIEHTRDLMQDGKMVGLGRDRRGIHWVYGNFVSIRVTAKQRVILCHLQQQTIEVQPGDLVVAGQPIGRCGNSGRSFGPHVHIHAQDVAIDRDGDGIPIAFVCGTDIVVPLAGDVIEAPIFDQTIERER